MSLKKKIILSFSISALIIAILAGFEYINFIKIRKEIQYLEITETVRSKSLELRRHEKNFLLRADTAEIDKVFSYLKDLNRILSGESYIDGPEKLTNLKKKIEDYEETFNEIVTIFRDIQGEFEELKPPDMRDAMFFALVESTFLERPMMNAELLEDIFLLDPRSSVTESLRKLSSRIDTLRKEGENIIVISKELDRAAREKVDSFINESQLAILVFFPLFVVVGIGTFLFVISNVVKRLQILTDVVEKTGRGCYTDIDAVSRMWSGNDEINVLMQKFGQMEHQLTQRENELFQSKKLAAIGTFASGIAHELNNPLNNIYTSAQRLAKKAGSECPESVRSGLDDIFSQTMRVKRIVGDLLEFARGREPQYRKLEMNSLLTGLYDRFRDSGRAENIRFLLDSDPEGVWINADPEQIEQVFINLFANSAESMAEGGTISVCIGSSDEQIDISFTDTGKGIPHDMIEKIFEPFFTTKDKGTGLGLAIVFNIIQKHHGEIKVESESGRGTVFAVTLPKRKG